ncbi:MAG: tetratricopeptide repeat protein, partial [Acidobacteria bacterium]|nr:tetratricopeptide repeat protein [Acidobacteriota bacterium]
MPGWHAAIQEQGLGESLQTVGILLEQHPDRARLFMQWKGMDWPLMVDSLNLLDLSYVPITLLLDENGIIRGVNPEIGEVAGFVRHVPESEAKPGATGSSDRTMSAPSLPRLRTLRDAARKGGAAERLEYADSLVLWGGTRRLDQAIEAYGRVLEIEPDSATAHFHLG